MLMLMNSHRILILILGFCGLMSCQPAKSPQDINSSPQPLQNNARFQTVSCDFDLQDDNYTVLCGQLSTRHNKTSQLQNLKVIQLINNATDKKSDPILYITGGPGGSTGLDKDGLQSWLSRVKRLDFKRDWILFDQRGVGLSRPHLPCKDLANSTRQALSEDLSVGQELANYKASLIQCQKQLEKKYDLSLYSTQENVVDITDLMDQLAYPFYNLYGSSYGTKVALELLRTNSSKIRSVILESVYPTNIHRTLSLPFVLDQAINHIFNYCQNKATCIVNHINLKREFKNFLIQLKQEPQVYLVSDPLKKGQPIEFVLNDQRLINSLFAGLYDAKYFLPNMADAITGKNDAALINLIQYYVFTQLDDNFYDAVYFSVECTDQPQYKNSNFTKAINEYPSWREYLQPIPRFDICQDWPVTPAMQLPEGVSSNIPTLLLSGGYDPVTPKEWAIMVKNQLKNSQHIIDYSAGHSVMDGSTCIKQLSRLFLAEPNKAFDTSCLKESNIPIQISTNNINF